jgi:hypothetical protein
VRGLFKVRGEVVKKTYTIAELKDLIADWADQRNVYKWLNEAAGVKAVVDLLDSLESEE